jgi:hypothetical protein
MAQIMPFVVATMFVLTSALPATAKSCPKDSVQV